MGRIVTAVPRAMPSFFALLRNERKSFCLLTVTKSVDTFCETLILSGDSNKLTEIQNSVTEIVSKNWASEKNVFCQSIMTMLCRCHDHGAYTLKFCYVSKKEI